jgi:trk system potassium uptake protein TrkH
LYGVARFFFVYAMLDVLWATLLVFDGVSVFDAISVSISTMGS